MATGGPRTDRIRQAGKTYHAALNAWLDEPFKHDDNAPATIMLREAALELRAALHEAGVQGRQIRYRGPPLVD